MSVPVRYTAAANHAVVESGLSNTLQQEEQYHQQQQQQQELYYQLYNNNNTSNDLEQQQQLMQQRSSMSSSVSPSTALPAIINTNATMEQEASTSSSSSPSSTLSPPSPSSSPNSLITIAAASTSSSLSSPSLMNANDIVMPTTASAMMTYAATAAAAAALAETDDSDNTEMRTECMRMSDEDEGRYGTPGAAGLEYQQYELEQQQQSPIMNNNIHNDQPMAPSLMDNENIDNNNMHLVNELFALSTEELYAKLKEYNVLQDKYHTILLLPRESQREVTCGGRDGSAYVLRCLKMWYRLPSDVLFSALSLVDRFLDRMTVKPKHMACMSVASFYLAIRQKGLEPIPTDDLILISQCGCTPGDLDRMANVIASKLGIPADYDPTTSLTFVRLYYVLFYNLARDIGGTVFEFFLEFIKLEDLINRLEILLCDVQTTVVMPSTLALVLFCLHLDFHIKESNIRGKPSLKPVFEYILHLQQFLRIPDRVLNCGFSVVSDILSHYNGQNKAPYRQRLVWRLSSRTLRQLRPTNRFQTDLPTIEEGISNTMDDGCRSRTESISSEEEEDWPTSPIIPIFEQC